MSNFVAWLGQCEHENHLSIHQTNEILRVGQAIWDAAGLPNNPELDDASLAVTRHEFRAMKEKAIEICPQLEHEIRTFDTQDSPFWQHPVNVQIREFQEWLPEQVDQGKIPFEVCTEILREGYQAFSSTGAKRGPEVDEITVAAFHRQLHTLKARTIEHCPELADAVRNMTHGHRR